MPGARLALPAKGEERLYPAMKLADAGSPLPSCLGDNRSASSNAIRYDAFRKFEWEARSRRPSAPFATVWIGIGLRAVGGEGRRESGSDPCEYVR
jgi:hypothetical protein